MGVWCTWGPLEEPVVSQSYSLPGAPGHGSICLEWAESGPAMLLHFHTIYLGRGSSLVVQQPITAPFS